MADVVWKFPFELSPVFSIDMPEDANILHVGMQIGEQPFDAKPCVWARVTPDRAVVRRRFVLVGTGHPLPDGDHRHVGTFFTGPLATHVWHLFEYPE